MRFHKMHDFPPMAGKIIEHPSPVRNAPTRAKIGLGALQISA